jgi:hypothetical protein
MPMTHLLGGDGIVRFSCPEEAGAEVETQDSSNQSQLPYSSSDSRIFCGPADFTNVNLNDRGAGSRHSLLAALEMKNGGTSHNNRTENG